MLDVLPLEHSQSGQAAKAQINNFLLSEMVPWDGVTVCLNPTDESSSSVKHSRDSIGFSSNVTDIYYLFHL